METGIKRIISMLTVLVMIIGLCSCSKPAPEPEPAPEAETVEETAEETASGDVFAGEMIDAQNNRLVVKGTDETMLFATTDKTDYDLKEEKELCVGDKIEVNYHKGDDMFVADKVTLTEHEEELLVFGGEVTELEKDFLTVHSESLTVVFTYNSRTKFQGDLTKGDSVTVTYKGNISGNPHAVSVVVIQEKQEKAEKSIHGTVSQIAKDSVVISIDSAHAARFRVTSDTKITGDAKELKLGDEVHLV